MAGFARVTACSRPALGRPPARTPHPRPRPSSSSAAPRPLPGGPSPPPIRSIDAARASAVAPGSEFGSLSPRQLAANLDEYVISQSKAKRVLAVAVFNHYLRIKANAPPISIPTPSTATGAVGYIDPYSSHAFSVFPNRDAGERNTSLSPARSKPTLGREGIVEQQIERRYPDLLKKMNLGPKGQEGDLVGDPESPAVRVEPRRRTRTFDNSYPPSSERRREPIISLQLVEESTTVSASIAMSASVHPPPPITSTHPEQAILTDFPGQVAGSAYVPPPPPSSTIVSEKSNVLMIGPTGTGKTYLARVLAKALDVPFVSVEATGLTMSGYVGLDVESCIHRLLVEANFDVQRAGVGIVVIDEIDKLARSPSAGVSKDVSGEGVQQGLLKILEGTIVTVPEEASGGRGRKGAEALQVDTTNILFILSGAFVGLEKIVAQRLTNEHRAASPATPQLKNAVFDFGEELPSHILQGKEEDLLDSVEPADFHQFGFLQEFIGRLPVVATLKPLSEEDLLRILVEPKNALLAQYESLFLASGITLKFTTPALREIARQAVTKGSGARGLRRLMEKTLLDAMFETPQSSVKYVLVDREVVQGSKGALYFSRGEKLVFEGTHAAEEAQAEAEQTVQEESA